MGIDKPGQDQVAAIVGDRRCPVPRPEIVGRPHIGNPPVLDQNGTPCVVPGRGMPRQKGILGKGHDLTDQ